MIRRPTPIGSTIGTIVGSTVRIRGNVETIVVSKPWKKVGRLVVPRNHTHGRIKATMWVILTILVRSIVLSIVLAGDENNIIGKGPHVDIIHAMSRRGNHGSVFGTLHKRAGTQIIVTTDTKQKPTHRLVQVRITLLETAVDIKKKYMRLTWYKML